MDNQKLNEVRQPALEQANVKRCTLINEIEVVIRIADGATVHKVDEVPFMLEIGLDVYLCSVKKDGKEYEVYIA